MCDVANARLFKDGERQKQKSSPKAYMYMRKRLDFLQFRAGLPFWTLGYGNVKLISTRSRLTASSTTSRVWPMAKVLPVRWPRRSWRSGSKT